MQIISFSQKLVSLLFNWKIILRYYLSYDSSNAIVRPNNHQNFSKDVLFDAVCSDKRGGGVMWLHGMWRVRYAFAQKALVL